ncbi:MAG: helix-turn-helix transcriptional regulator [Bacteroidetes bacterium]|nr:helix-turn-helix transcriptional regulator [Bacteroidota bacterium]
MSKQPEKKKAPSKKISKASVSNKTGELISQRLKQNLDLSKRTFEDVSKAAGITSSSLYRALKRGKLTVVMLEDIAKFLNVPVSYFFENELVDLLTEEVLKYDKNPDLKSFLLGFSREISKGWNAQDAAGRAIDQTAYWNDRLI